MHSHRSHRGRMFAGIILLLAGLALLLRNAGILPIGSLWQYWPVILIVAGVMKLLNYRSETETTPEEDVHGT